MERVTGIEPAQLAWKARTLPLSYTRVLARYRIVTSGPRLLPSSTGRSVVASAPGLGPGDRRFESSRPDKSLLDRVPQHKYLKIKGARS